MSTKLQLYAAVVVSTVILYASETWKAQEDTIRWTILTCAQKLTSSQLRLPHGTKQKKNNEETKTNTKRRCSEETVRS